MNRKSTSSVPARQISAPWRIQHPNYASSSGLRVSAKRLRDVAGPMLPDSNVTLLTNCRSGVPSIFLAVDRTSGAIVGWDVYI